MRRDAQTQIREAERAEIRAQLLVLFTWLGTIVLLVAATVLYVASV